MSNRFVVGFIFGIAALLFSKYIVLGLRIWNHTLHPGRIEPSTLRQFQNPFLGLFGKGAYCGICRNS